MPPGTRFSGGEEGIIHGKKIPLVSGAMGTLRSVSVVVRGESFLGGAHRLLFRHGRGDRRRRTESARGDHPARRRKGNPPGYHPGLSHRLHGRIGKNLAHGIFPAGGHAGRRTHTLGNHPRGGKPGDPPGRPGPFSLHRTAHLCSGLRDVGLAGLFRETRRTVLERHGRRMEFSHRRGGLFPAASGEKARRRV